MRNVVDDALSPLGASTSRARLLTIVWLVTSTVSILLLPMVGVAQERSVTLRVLATGAIVVFFGATVAVMWSAVTPWTSTAAHARAQLAFVVSALAAIPLVAPVAAGQWATWAWLGAAVVGTAPLLWRWPVAVAVALLCTLVSATVASLTGGSLIDHVVITAGMGAGLAAVNWCPVWLWELLVRAETSRASASQLAAAQERLRFAQDLHDVLGHDLTVIALKSELAARTAHQDPASAAREAADVRRLAEDAIERVRATAAGYRETDLAADLERLAALLGSTGVHCDLRVETEVAGAAGGVLSAIAKEATTNLLRHSDARCVRISVVRVGDQAVLTVVNDGVRPDRRTAPGGTGLDGMRARLSPLGGVVRSERSGGTFSLVAQVPGWS
jgi:two-component system sensor histidine kinase DesK